MPCRSRKDRCHLRRHDARIHLVGYWRKVWIQRQGRGSRRPQGHRIPDVDAYDQWREKAAERPYLDITVSDYLQQNATEEELNSGADIAEVLIRWQKENDLPPVSDVSSVSHTIQPIQQIQENPIKAEIRKYISPEYWTEVAALIEDFDLELVSVTRIESEQ